MSKFIKLTDYQPSEGQVVIVAEKANGEIFGVTCAEYSNKKFSPWVDALDTEYDKIRLNIKPTHWAPLPEIE